MHIQTSAAQTLVTTTETTIATIPPMSIPGYGPGQAGGTQAVQLRAIVSITTGAGATGVQLRFRQNTGAGTPVGINPQQESFGAGATANMSAEAVDEIGSAGGWVLTAQQVGATGNGTVNGVYLNWEPV